MSEPLPSRRPEGGSKERHRQGALEAVSLEGLPCRGQRPGEVRLQAPHLRLHRRLQRVPGPRVPGATVPLTADGEPRDLRGADSGDRAGGLLSFRWTRL